MNILLAHGSSDSRHATQAQLLAEKAAEELGAAVELRFLSSEKMPEGAHVLPLLLGEGWHAKHDITRLAAASDCTMLPALSARSIPIACMAADLAIDCFPDLQASQCSALFSIYHFDGFETVTKALEGLTQRFSDVAVAGIYSSPTLEESLVQWREDGVQNIVVQPMALFEGRTMEHVRRTVAQSEVDAQVGPVLSSHAGFPGFIADCFRESHAS
ncbi:sirohydrochlorin chelatase [Pseudomonadota bacterium]